MKEIGKALLSAQQEIEGVSKDSTNPHFGSHYADLTAVLEAVVPVLNKYGVVVVQHPSTPPTEGTLALTTLLLHAESGESISGVAVVPLAKQDPQAYGSATTYARRYSLGAMVGLKFLDDDGNTASGNPPRTSGKKVDKPTPPKSAGGGALAFLNKKKPDGESTPTGVKAKPPVRGKAPLFPVPSKPVDEADIPY